MTRFILSWLLVLGCLMGTLPLKATQSSKRSSDLAIPASKPTGARAVAKAACAVAKATKAVISSEVAQAAAKARKLASTSGSALGNGLARVTAYWGSEGDYYTRRHVSATGVRLHNGHCAVDPRVIPYGSIVTIQGLGTYLAVDTGTAVVSRRAARESGHNKTERHALVVDIYFESRKDGERFAAGGPKFAAISWSIPGTQVAVDTTSAHTLASLDGTSRSKAL